MDRHASKRVKENSHDRLERARFFPSERMVMRRKGDEPEEEAHAQRDAKRDNSQNFSKVPAEFGAS